MKSLDTLYYSLAVGFVILVLFMSYAAYQLSKTMISLRKVIDNVEDVTTDVSRIKNLLKVGIFGVLANLMDNVMGRRRQ